MCLWVTMTIQTRYIERKLSHLNKMEYALYTERPMTSRAGLFFAQTSLLASVKDTYRKFSGVWTE